MCYSVHFFKTKICTKWCLRGIYIHGERIHKHMEMMSNRFEMMANPKEHRGGYRIPEALEGNCVMDEGIAFKTLMMHV